MESNMDALRSGAIFLLKNMGIVRSPAQPKLTSLQPPQQDSNRNPPEHIGVVKETFENIYRATPIPKFLLPESSDNGQGFLQQQQLSSPSTRNVSSFQHDLFSNADGLNIRGNSNAGRSQSTSTHMSMPPPVNILNRPKVQYKTTYLMEPPVSRGQSQYNSSESNHWNGGLSNNRQQDHNSSGNYGNYGNYGNFGNYNSFDMGRDPVSSSNAHTSPHRDHRDYKDHNIEHSALPRSPLNGRYDRSYSGYNEHQQTDQRPLRSPNSTAINSNNSLGRNHNSGMASDVQPPVEEYQPLDDPAEYGGYGDDEQYADEAAGGSDEEMSVHSDNQESQKRRQRKEHGDRSSSSVTDSSTNRDSRERSRDGRERSRDSNSGGRDRDSRDSLVGDGIGRGNRAQSGNRSSTGRSERQSGASQPGQRPVTGNRGHAQSSRVSGNSRTNSRTSGPGDSLVALFAGGGQQTEKRKSADRAASTSQGSRGVDSHSAPSSAAQANGDSKRARLVEGQGSSDNITASSVPVQSSGPNSDNGKRGTNKLSVSRTDSSSAALSVPPPPVTPSQSATQTASGSTPMFVIHQPLVRKKNPAASATTTTATTSSNSSSSGGNSGTNPPVLITPIESHQVETSRETIDARETLTRSNRLSRPPQRLVESDYLAQQQHATAEYNQSGGEESHSGMESAVAASAVVSAAPKKQNGNKKLKTNKWLPEERQELYAVCSLFPGKSAESYWGDVAAAFNARFSVERSRTSEECKLFWEEMASKIKQKKAGRKTDKAAPAVVHNLLIPVTAAQSDAAPPQKGTIAARTGSKATSDPIITIKTNGTVEDADGAAVAVPPVKRLTKKKIEVRPFSPIYILDAPILIMTCQELAKAAVYDPHGDDLYSAQLKSGGSGKKVNGSDRFVSTPHLAARLAEHFGDVKTPADGTPIANLARKKRNRGGAGFDGSSSGSDSSAEDSDEFDRLVGTMPTKKKLHLPRSYYDIKSSKTVMRNAAKMNGTNVTCHIRKESSDLLARNTNKFSAAATAGRGVTRVQSEGFSGSIDPRTGQVAVNRRAHPNGQYDSEEEESMGVEGGEEETFEDEEGDF